MEYKYDISVALFRGRSSSIVVLIVLVPTRITMNEDRGERPKAWCAAAGKRAAGRCCTKPEGLVYGSPKAWESPKAFVQQHAAARSPKAGESPKAWCAEAGKRAAGRTHVPVERS